MNARMSMMLLLLLVLFMGCGTEQRGFATLKQDELVIETVNGKQLTVMNPAKDSLLALFRSQQLDVDSLWFTLEEHDDSIIPPLPDWAEGDSSEVASYPRQEVLGPYLALYVSGSRAERDLFVSLQENERRGVGEIGSYSSRWWDFVVALNMQGDQILRVEL